MPESGSWWPDSWTTKAQKQVSPQRCQNTRLSLEKESALTKRLAIRRGGCAEPATESGGRDLESTMNKEGGLPQGPDHKGKPLYRACTGGALLFTRHGTLAP